MEKNTAICDVSVFVSKSKYRSVKRVIENLGIEEVIMPKELVEILLKVYREEKLSGDEVRVLSYWSRGPVPRDDEIKDFFEELMSENLKLRTVSEYIIKKEVEYGYRELEEGERHEEMDVFDKTWRALFESFVEFLPKITAIIVSKILAISLVFNIKILAFNSKLLKFLKDANLIVSEVKTSIKIKEKRFSHMLLFLKSYGGTTYENIFRDVSKSMKETVFVPVDLERRIGSITILLDS
ncbi:MAG: hypothetical protein ACE5K0_04165 [Candidatus Methanofastidiosia archaeon]